MDIQEIFSRVISSGHYGTRPLRYYMCIALSDARYHNCINEDEYNYAMTEIEKYIGDITDSLSGLLEQRGLPHEDKDTLAIYTDWENRPCLD